MTLAYAAIAYLAVVWVGLRLVIPHLGFGADPVPERLPPDLAELVERFNAEAKSDTEFLEKCYAYVTAHYRGSRVKTISHFCKAFGDPFDAPPGYLPCTLQNFILRALLVRSGRFAPIEVQTRVVPLNLFIHQYLEVRADGTLLEVDPWSAFLGVPLGKRSAWVG